MKDYYTILEVPSTATQEEIREQYNFLIQAWHPDKFRNPQQKAKAEEKSKEVNIAYSILKDSSKRAEYDCKLSGQPSRVRPAESQRPPEEYRSRRQAEQGQPRPGYERPQAERAEREHRRTHNETDASAPEEWILLFFEQARRRQSKQSPAKINKSHQAPVRVLLVGDVAETQLHIRRLLNSETDIKIVGEASDGVEAVTKFDALMPDVTTICISTPSIGLTATEAIRRKHPLAKVIMISVEASTSYIRRAMLAGACDYLITPPRAANLQSAIRMAAMREIPVSGRASTK